LSGRTGATDVAAHGRRFRHRYVAADSLPYAIFNIANPLIALLFGFTGIGVERLSAPAGKGLPGMSGSPAV